jgi:hypothetical protein
MLVQVGAVTAQDKVRVHVATLSSRIVLKSALGIRANLNICKFEDDANTFVQSLAQRLKMLFQNNQKIEEIEIVFEILNDDLVFYLMTADDIEEEFELLNEVMQKMLELYVITLRHANALEAFLSVKVTPIVYYRPFAQEGKKEELLAKFLSFSDGAYIHDEDGGQSPEPAGI